MKPYERTPKWMGWVLLATAIYNVAWGAWVVLFPFAWFDLARMARPLYPEIWQLVGLMFGSFGIAFGLASRDPYRHWPIVLTGLIGKIGAMFGFVYAVERGRLPASAGWPLFVNDLIWVLPFFFILHAAWHSHENRRRVQSPQVLPLALRSRVEDGRTLEEMSQEKPLLLVFLRHAGCPFCRETLTDLRAQRRQIEESGTQIALVTMVRSEDTLPILAEYGLAGVPFISDPRGNLYRAFGLGRTGLWGILGPQAVLRGAYVVLIKRFGLNVFGGDFFQMPGIFLVFHGQVLRSFRHQAITDRPDYVKFVNEHATPAMLS